MYFVFSSWYIVIAVLAVLAIAGVVAFILMDKKDRSIIQEFVSRTENKEIESQVAESASDSNHDSINE